MTTVSTIKAVLDGDATLLATATGGIWDYDETGRLGLNRTTTPAAFDATGIIKPSILVKSRGSQPSGGLADDVSQYSSLREAIEIWFYEDSGYTNIGTMRDRVYLLVHAVQLTGTFIAYWSNDIRGVRDEAMDASVERSEYTVWAKRST